MVENKLSCAKGASIHMPHMFSGVNYQFLKLRIKILIQTIDQGIWDAIVNRPFVPKHIVNNKQVIIVYF